MGGGGGGGVWIPDTEKMFPPPPKICVKKVSSEKATNARKPCIMKQKSYDFFLFGEILKILLSWNAKKIGEFFLWKLHI
jgi:hypothetical protein